MNPWLRGPEWTDDRDRQQAVGGVIIAVVGPLLFLGVFYLILTYFGGGG